MITRREALARTVCAPLLCFPAGPAIKIISERTLLSEESAAGYRLQTAFDLSRPVLVLAGVACPSRRTMDAAQSALLSGSFVVMESALGFCSPDEIGRQSRRLNRQFALGLHERSATTIRYITYRWPQTTLVRSFGPALSFDSGTEEVMAVSEERPVALLRQQGRGTLLFLGAMLGPSLFAGEREAHHLWCQLVIRCAGKSSGGTSTRA